MSNSKSIKQDKKYIWHPYTQHKISSNTNQDSFW